MFLVQGVRPTIFFRGHNLFFGGLHGSENLRAAAVTTFVDGSGICIVVPYIRTCSRIVRSGMRSGIRGRLGEGMSCASPGGQRTIGIGRCGLEGVPIQGRRRGGTGTNRAGRHLRKNAISLGVKEEWKWNGRKQGGRFGPGGRKSHGTHRHDNARQGGRRTKKGLGLRKGTLALGTSMRGALGTRGTLKGAPGSGSSLRDLSNLIWF